MKNLIYISILVLIIFILISSFKYTETTQVEFKNMK